MTEERRFLRKVDFPRTKDGCWEWLGYRQPKGYGLFSVKHYPIHAHRWAWAWWHGKPIPEGLTVDHLCLNKGCVRPDHMEIVTRSENTARGNRQRASSL